MPDMEKVIKGLEYCKEYFNCCDKCPYWDGGTHCTADLAHDALAVLKEQEAVKPIPPTDESDLWKCGYCNHQLFRCTQQRYCEMCGRSVKWE